MGLFRLYDIYSQSQIMMIPRTIDNQQNFLIIKDFFHEN